MARTVGIVTVASIGAGVAALAWVALAEPPKSTDSAGPPTSAQAPTGAPARTGQAPSADAPPAGGGGAAAGAQAGGGAPAAGGGKTPPSWHQRRKVSSRIPTPTSPKWLKTVTRIS